MAARNSKSRPHPPQGRARSKGSAAIPTSAARIPRVLREAIESERARLMTAEAILHCVVLALDEADPGDSKAPYYQWVIDTARDLVIKAINELDSVALNAVLKHAGTSATGVQHATEGAAGKCEIKEPALPYLH